ncbi:hypothetical protein Bca101_057875 [Brassica carinata]
MAAREEAQTIPTARKEHRSGLLCGETNYRDTHLNQTFRDRTNSRTPNITTTEARNIEIRRNQGRQRRAQEKPN